MDNNLQCQVRIKRVYGTDNSKQRPNCWQMIMWAANNGNKHLTTESEQSWAKFQNNLTSGEKSFFLQPGEKLERGIQDFYVLMEDEGLILKCIEAYLFG